MQALPRLIALWIFSRLVHWFICNNYESAIIVNENHSLHACANYALFPEPVTLIVQLYSLHLQPIITSGKSNTFSRLSPPIHEHNYIHIQTHWIESDKLHHERMIACMVTGLAFWGSSPCTLWVHSMRNSYIRLNSETIHVGDMKSDALHHERMISIIMIRMTLCIQLSSSDFLTCMHG